MLASVVGFGHAVVDARHVADLHRMAGHLAEDDVAELSGDSTRPRVRMRDRLRALLDAAARDVGVLRLQRARDVVDRQVVARSRSRSRARR